MKYWPRIAVAPFIVCLALHAGSAQAVSAPSATAKGAEIRMLDARVNLRAEYQRAVSARKTAADAGLLRAKADAGAIAAAIAERKHGLPGLEVHISALTGAPTLLKNRAGALTAQSNATSESIVRGFLASAGAMYGLSADDLSDLVVLGDSPGGSSHLRMLRMEQQIDGMPVFQSETRFVIDPRGRLVNSAGVMVPHARKAAPAVDWTQLLSPGEAVARLLTFEGKSASAGSFVVSKQTGGRFDLDENDAYVAGPITARQVLFPLAPGLLVPAWSLVVFTEGTADWYAMVDAKTGDVLWRKNIRNYVSAQDARFRVFVQADGVTPADSPAPASPNAAASGSGTQFPYVPPTIVSMHTAMDATASPNGWIDDCPGGGCTANETQTLGNNVLACLDRAAPANVCDTDAASILDGNGRPTGNPDGNARNRDFLGTTPRVFDTNFLPPPQTTASDAEVGQTATGAGASGTAAIDSFRRGVVTHIFYVTNWYHDQLFKLGFDEASGNFQQTNFSGMGLGGDRVLADAQDGSGTNNANFATPPDGTSGRMQMYRFTGPTIDRDGDLDAEVSMHEMTHGTSNRLVGNGAGLNWDPAGGMGEGWSDFVALSLLNNSNADNPNGHYASGGYATYKLQAGYLDNYVYGIRRFPYTTDHSVNPMTWADVDDVTNNLSGGIAPSPVAFNNNGGMEVHNSGEIWALTLWGVRARIIADPAGANGDVPTGNHTMLQDVIDGLKMTPIDPSFTDARDAILDADCAANACANEQSIWDGFADRGLGYGAATPYNVAFGFTASHLGVRESFLSPYLDVVNAATDVTIDDTATNNNGVIDPGEAVKLTVKLTNPWRGASKAVTSATATLATSTPGVAIFDNTSTYGAIAPQGTATGDSFTVAVGPGVLCGSAIDFTLTTVSNLSLTVTTFRLRVGAASGTDPVVTYTHTPSPALAIPDGRPLAVFDQMTVTDDFQIADVDFRLDSVTHTFTGDLTFELRSPAGVGVDMISLIGALIDGGSGDNITNMVADDDQPSSAATDMVEAAPTDAPYTKSWLPVFNAPWTTLAGFPSPDPVGNLSRFDGTSTKGTWSVAASDQFQVDTGTLNAWSMLVTPVHFVCSAVTPAVTMAATKTVSGTFTVGGTVTYTVTLTNSGSGGQANNVGHEFTDTLPSGLTLTGATATSGTAATAGNTVNWDGTVAPLGGSVTITITATVNTGTQGTTISNQGTANVDTNVDTTNETALLTDDPAVGGAADPTSFVVVSTSLAATKTVAGTFHTGGTVTYTITISNPSANASPDNPGNEFTDVLPAGLTLVSASASSGTAVATVATNTVTWNGSVPAGGSVTITIAATVNASAGGTTVSNQGSVSFDADLNGTNETTVQTDDPTVAGAADPTSFAAAADVVAVPTLSDFALLALGGMLWLAGWLLLRRRSQRT